MQAAMVLINGMRSTPPQMRRFSPNYPRSAGEPKPLFLYVAYCRGFAKIGITENIKTRIAGMQSGNPFPIETVFAQQMSRDEAMAAEHAALLALSDCHWFGDWFKASRSHARFVVESMVRKAQEASLKPADPPSPPQPKPKAPGLARRVLGPRGEVFESCAKAAKSFGLTRQAMHARLEAGWGGWKWEEP